MENNPELSDETVANQRARMKQYQLVSRRDLLGAGSIFTLETKNEQDVPVCKVMILEDKIIITGLVDLMFQTGGFYPDVCLNTDVGEWLEGYLEDGYAGLGFYLCVTHESNYDPGIAETQVQEALTKLSHTALVELSHDKLRHYEKLAGFVGTVDFEDPNIFAQLERDGLPIRSEDTGLVVNPDLIDAFFLLERLVKILQDPNQGK